MIRKGFDVRKGLVEVLARQQQTPKCFYHSDLQKCKKTNFRRSSAIG